MENPLKMCMPRSLQDVIRSVRRSTSFIKSQTPTNRKTEKGIHWFLKQRRLKIPIITTSRCSYTHGKDVAEAVAKTLGYTCLSREALLDASQEFNMPGIKLVRELPIILEQTIFNKYRYISYIRSALLKHLAKGKVVYHGFCGHILLKDIDHVLKVQITADLEDRVKLVMDRDGFSRNEALLFIKTMDDARKKWCQKLYKIDLSKICQYDISLNISKFPIDKAVDIICKIDMLERFKTTSESRRAMDELLIAADAKAKKFTDFVRSYLFHRFFDEGLTRL